MIKQPNQPEGNPWRLAVDTGGTFTDLVMMDEAGTIAVHKVPSSPSDYARAIVEGAAHLLNKYQIASEDVLQLIHGTTVPTNAILEQKGARTALVTTRGFRDVLEIRRLSMPKLYDLGYVKPPPLVPRELRFEVAERLDHRGEVVLPVDEDSVSSVCTALRETGVESVAITLLHSYANPAHEKRVEDLLAAGGSWHISRSSRILPQIEEYRRASTTVINAYIKPVVSAYLQSLREKLAAAGINGQILVMQSNGGVMTAELASEMPVMIVESGPAAGVVGAAKLAETIGLSNLITFDMGGTTAKASLIEQGAVAQATEYEVGASVSSGTVLDLGRGYLLGVPSISIAEVGAGGGSLAWIDSGGVMQVGPGSAGASPGPICYGLGGEQPTVTDANMILGYLNPDELAGGGIKVDLERCRHFFSRNLAEPLGLSPEEAALGVHRIANANMQKTIRAVTVERGRNPAQFAMLAFGGSGPVHGATLASSLKIGEVIVPAAAGLFSALGLLFSDLSHHVTLTYFHKLGTLNWDGLGATVEDLRGEAAAILASEHIAPDQISVRVSADLRYVGQAHELQLTLSNAKGELIARSHLVAAFTERYRGRYGHALPDGDLEIVNLRAEARRSNPGTAEWPRLGDGRHKRSSSRRCYFADLGFVTTSILGRRDLSHDPRVGPLIIEEYDSTTVVPPGWIAQLDDHGNIRLQPGRPT